VHMAHERVESKTTDYHWIQDERSRFNVCMYTPRCHVHKICSPLGDALSGRECQRNRLRMNVGCIALFLSAGIYKVQES
jgi:hypothetical protein